MYFGVGLPRGTPLVFSEASASKFKAVLPKDLPAICAKTSDEQQVVLVTGGAGFVGFHTSLALQKKGAVVVGYDNFNDYYPVSLKRARQEFLVGKGITVVEADLNDPDALGTVFRVCKFTHVIHLAAQAGVRYAARNPQSYVQSNIAGTVALLEVAKGMTPKPRVVYASSSSVYGLNTKTPFSEEDRVDVPASLYAATKRSTEVIAHVYYRLYSLSVTGLRFFTVYGPWGRPDMAYMSFSRRLMEEEPIRIFQGPNGEELSRDFTFIDDIVGGIIGSMDATPPSESGKAWWRVFNLGNTHPVGVTNLVQILAEALGKKPELAYAQLPALGDVLFTHANISAAQAEFGYQPKTDLKEGLGVFVEWYLKYYGADGKTMAADEQSYKPD